MIKGQCWSFVVGLAAAGAVGGCSAELEREQVGTAALAAAPAPGDVVVTWSGVKQTMKGFGASSAFFGSTIADADADWFFSAKTGIGLSLLRIQLGLPADVKSDGTEPSPGMPVATSPELATAKQAVARGARVWASSWSPPPVWKTTNNKNGSGTGFASNKLQPARYGDYATYLADFVELMKTNGVPLVALSPQNEPDYVASWDNAQWTGAELTTFVRANLGPTFAQRGITAAIVLPDSAHWNNLPNFVDPLMADATAKGYVEVIATHPYPSGSQPINLTYSKPRDNGKEFWQTEVSQENLSGDTPDPSINSALTMAKMIHDHVVTAQMNAWCWWALTIAKSELTDNLRMNPALIQDGVRFKRGYALGNFAKFVRPGFQRLDATAKPTSTVYVSAYRDATHVAIVAVNDGSAAVTQKFRVDGGSFGSVTPWVTSASDNLAAKAAITATDNFSYSLPAKSVVTFANWDAASETPDPIGGGGPGGASGTGGATGAGGAGAGGQGGGTAATGGRSGSTGGAGASGSGGLAGGSGGRTGTAGVSGGGGSGTAGSGAGSSSGGATGSGGGAASGGATSSGGAPASGGATGTGTGGASTGGKNGTPATGPDSAGSGCSCDLGSPGGGSGTWLGVLFAAALAVSRRRDRRRRHERSAVDVDQVGEGVQQ